MHPYAEEAAKVYPTAHTAEPCLLLPPRVTNAIDRFADDQVYSTELHDQQIDADEAVGTVNHRKHGKLLKWESVTGHLQKSTIGPMDTWWVKDSDHRACCRTSGPEPGE